MPSKALVSGVSSASEHPTRILAGRVGNRVRQISLTRGFVALVDDADYERLSQYSWCVRIDKRPGRNEHTYAARYVGPSYRRKTIFMHSEVCGYARPDHIDGDGLNNQKYNLRPATRSQNAANRSKREGFSSSFLGVSWSTKSQKWHAQIVKDGKRFHLGMFRDEVDAAQAYNLAADELHGEFARFNTPLQNHAARRGGLRRPCSRNCIPAT